MECIWSEICSFFPDGCENCEDYDDGDGEEEDSYKKYLIDAVVEYELIIIEYSDGNFR